MSNPSALTTAIDGYAGYHFSFELFGKALDGVTEVSGLAMENTPVEIKQVDMKGIAHQRKVPGQAVQPGTFNAKMVASPGSPVETEYFKGLKQGKAKVGDAAVTLYDGGGAKVMQWGFTDVFVKDLAWGELSAAEPQAMVLDLTIQYNDVKVTK